MAENRSDGRKVMLVAIDAVGLVLCVVALIWLARMSREGTEIPEIAWVTLGMLVQQFGSGLLTAHNYDFGSSAGSSAKNPLLVASRPADPEPRKEP